MSILEVEHIQKSFERTEVLKDISFSLNQGDVLSIIGSSGSGKTTLLRCLNFLERPDQGVIRVNGETLFDAGDPSTQRESEIRKKRLHFGLVFQSFNLFPQYTALENVMLAKELLAQQQPDYKARKKEIHGEIQSQAEALLHQMGLADRMENYPHQLSGGQQQRVSIARALAGNPSVILADEPTGALDSRTGREVLSFLQKLNREGDTVVLITHDNSIAVKANRIVRLQDGRIIYDGDARDPKAVVQPEEDIDDIQGFDAPDGEEARA